MVKMLIVKIKCSSVSFDLNDTKDTRVDFSWTIHSNGHANLSFAFFGAATGDATRWSLDDRLTNTSQH